ncbi:hypothetical protein PHYBOEH_008048 [Phytophthora boehmeriae]|uniref:RxLR effector protein n=1 Tax=Phytophthora boehmeriae TaxID=109152 RepID=A0A8T1X359_9STRA|nr:hypothetical protein PHYBOEH_008048 [Phytophthora boehmeriae]
MRLTLILLVLASALVASCNAASFDPTKLSEAAFADLIQSSAADQSDPTTTRFLRTGKSDIKETGVVVDEERGKLTNIAKNLIKDLKINACLFRDKDIRANLKTFKEWYNANKAPEDIWKEKNLGPLLKQRYNEWDGIGKLKADPDFQMYLKYEKFYKIMKGTYRKKT